MTAAQLLKASYAGKSITGLPWGLSPAVIVVSMQFKTVMRWLPKLKIYKPKHKNKKQPK